MAWIFDNQQKAQAVITKLSDNKTFKIAGVNGKQTNAQNFAWAMAGLLGIVGKYQDAGNTARIITQDVREE